jgi:hypothetical protein
LLKIKRFKYHARMVDGDEGPESSGTGKKYIDLLKEAFLDEKQFFSITPKIEYTIENILNDVYIAAPGDGENTCCSTAARCAPSGDSPRNSARWMRLGGLLL